jgi:uncharacterized membrane protein HdeD (DUF308 family)
MHHTEASRFHTPNSQKSGHPKRQRRAHAMHVTEERLAGLVVIDGFLMRRWSLACEGRQNMNMRFQSLAGPGTRGRVETALAQLAGPWWMFLVTGIGWLVISLIVLRFRLSSVVAVGVLMGVVFLTGWLSELLIASMRPRWRWAHVLMGILFLFAACWSFASPFGAFWALATIFGLLLIFRGSLDLVTAISAREINHAWWLGLIAGVLEILLGFWVSQQEFPAQALLLLLWVGFFALFRGFSDILLAFEVRRAA